MKKAILGIALMFTIFCTPLLSYATENPSTEDERIVNFSSNIVVNKDSTLDVTEKITVYADGVSSIKRGIYRDFPTEYKDDYGNKYKIKFSITSIIRDGKEDQYKVEKLANGIRIYIGKENVILNPGLYVYEISYKVTNELGFYEKEDILYWNVTGNGWSFFIDKAEAIVRLPDGVPFDKLSISAYTGYKGMNEQNFYSTTTNNAVYFSTTEKLYSNQGLTIAVGWPKGYVIEPTRQEKIISTLSNNIGIVSGGISFIIIFLYYLITWLIFGRDPKKGTIVAEYDSPDNLSPSSIRFNFIEGYDNKVFTSAIINMAVKGCLKIDNSSGQYKLMKTGKGQEKLSEEESIIFDILFSSDDTVIVSQKSYKKFQNAQIVLKKYLEKKFIGSYFVSNSKIFSIGIVLSVVLFLITSYFSETDLGLYIFMSLWLSIWSIGTFAIVTGAIKALKLKVKQGMLLSLFSIPFVAGEILGLVILLKSSSIFFALLLITFIGINTLFFRVIKRRTRIGQDLQDKIEGFKIFLSVTEKDRLNFSTPPEKTPELFEKFLPYALALNVEHSWAEQFDTIFNISDDNSSYHPIWYIGSQSSSFKTLGDFTNAFGTSFTSQISSSSHAPGSSLGGGGSSSHGGGSSGGGGGGGGGGGW